jgi:hypothetical protein
MTEEATTADTPKLAPGHVLSDDGTELKRCPGLGLDHVPDGAEIHQTHYAPLSEFGRNAGNADGLAWVCKTGQALYGKRSRENAGAAPKAPRVAKPKPKPKTKAKSESGLRTKKSVAQAMADQSRRESEKKAARKRTPKAAPAPIVEDQPTAEEPVVE